MIVNPAIPDYESPIRNGPVKYLVVHTAECAEYDGADVAVSGYLARTPSASIHGTVDNNSYTPSVPESRVAWAASNPLINNHALQAEWAGRADQGESGWDDAFSRGQLDVAAELYGRWVREHGIPVRHGTPQDLRNGLPGFYGHHDSTLAWNNPDGHYDPGPDFPWDRFLDLVRQHLGTTTAPPTSTDWFDMATKQDLIDVLKLTSPNVLAGRQDPKGVWHGFEVNAPFARHLSPEAWGGLKALGMRDVGNQGKAFWDRYTLVKDTPANEWPST